MSASVPVPLRPILDEFPDWTGSAVSERPPSSCAAHVRFRPGGEASSPRSGWVGERGNVTSLTVGERASDRILTSIVRCAAVVSPPGLAEATASGRRCNELPLWNKRRQPFPQPA